MKKEELLKALNTAERLLPDSDLVRELRKISETDEELEQKKKYIEMLAKNEFQTRDEIEKLLVSFKDDLLFMYDMTHFVPTEEEKKDYEDLKELLEFIEKNLENSSENKRIMEAIQLYDFKMRLSNESWDDVVTTFDIDVKEFKKLKLTYRKFKKLLNLAEHI